MINLLKKQSDGTFYYKGNKAEYIATVDNIGNSFLEIKGHETIKDGTTALCNPWLEGAEDMINRIEAGKKVLL